ncbi:ras-related protein Rab-30-like [Glandiceps talaboti]
MSQSLPASPSIGNLRTHKVILLGDAGVGKTCLFRRYMGEKFPRTTETTLTTRPSFPRRFQDAHGQPIEVDIWDTAGAERMRSLTENYYRHTSAALMVYDITSSESFDSIVTYWIDTITSRDEGVKLFLIGNKSDLLKDRDEEDARETIAQADKYFAQSQDGKLIKHFTVSAKRDDGVETMFHDVAQCLDKKDERKKKRSTIMVTDSEEDIQTKSFNFFDWLQNICK